MRRDLALCRERAGVSKHLQINGAESSGGLVKREDIAQPEVVQPVEPNQNAPVEDIVMQDSEPSQPVDLDKPEVEQSLDSKDRNDPSKPDDVSVEHIAEPRSSPEAAQADEEPSDPTLLIDTQLQNNTGNAEASQAEEDVSPDTGTFSNTNDLESLFGAPTSAEAGDAPDFGIDPNSNTQFDFGSFGTNLDNSAGDNDNDNIAALLPGLQDYANTQPSGSGEPDFDALFSIDLPMSTDGQQTSDERRDTTFDDLMDFADFNAGDFAAGAGGNTSNDNQDFDFSFD